MTRKLFRSLALLPLLVALASPSLSAAADEYSSYVTGSDIIVTGYVNAQFFAGGVTPTVDTLTWYVCDGQTSFKSTNETDVLPVAHPSLITDELELRGCADEPTPAVYIDGAVLLSSFYDMDNSPFPTPRNNYLSAVLNRQSTGMDDVDAVSDGIAIRNFLTVPTLSKTGEEFTSTDGTVSGAQGYPQGVVKSTFYACPSAVANAGVKFVPGIDLDLSDSPVASCDVLYSEIVLCEGWCATEFGNEFTKTDSLSLYSAIPQNFEDPILTYSATGKHIVRLTFAFPFATWSPSVPWDDAVAETSSSNSTPTHSVVLDANGGSGIPVTVTSRGQAQLPAGTYSKMGYMFSGWNTEADGSGVAYSDQTMVAFSSSLVLFAQWVPVKAEVKLKQYIATFAGDKPVLTSKMRVTIAGWVKKLPKDAVITCQGSTSGRKVTTFDRRLASNRAKNVCVEAVKKRSDLTYSIQLNPSSATKVSARHVWMIQN